MITISQLLTFVAEDVAATDGKLVGAELEPIVRATIKGLGFHVSTTTGEVCDPRPRPVVNFPERPVFKARGRRRGMR